jgi:hypothetical protein
MTEDIDYLPDRPEGDLNRIQIGMNLNQQYELMREEYVRGLRVSGSYSSFPYPEMAALFSMAKAQSQYPEVLKIYLDKWEALNRIYGTPASRSWEFFLDEVEQRKDIIEEMLVGLGITRLDSRPPAPEVVRYDYGYRFDGRKLVHTFWKERERENRNLNIILSGKVGGGKYYASLSIANYLNRYYDLSNVCYDITDFIDRVQNQPKGTVITLDEAGVSAGSKDAMSLASKSLSKTIQSTRYKQQVSIYCVPNLNYLDRTVRTMCDLVFTHEEGMLQGEFSVGIPELSEDGKDIVMTPVRVDHVTIKTVYFPLPPPLMVTEYERDRKEHNNKQLQELKDKLSPKPAPSEEPKESMRGKNPNSLKNLKPFSDKEVVE